MYFLILRRVESLKHVVVTRLGTDSTVYLKVINIFKSHRDHADSKAEQVHIVRYVCPSNHLVEFRWISIDYMVMESDSFEAQRRPEISC